MMKRKARRRRRSPSQDREPGCATDTRWPTDHRGEERLPADSHLLVKRRYLDLPPTTGRNAGLQDLPAELVEHIISFLSVRDVVFFGETCRYLHQVCDSRRTWRSLCLKSRPAVSAAGDWRRQTILDYTKGMYFHHFSSRHRLCGNTVPPAIPSGFQRFLAMADNLCVLDYAGTLFSIRGSVRNPSVTFVNREWRTHLNYAALCQTVKDFTSDPRNDTLHRKYLYVLATREVRDADHESRPCDCVEIYLQSTRQRIFKMTFHPSMKVKKIVLLGVETDRQMLLLTEEGKVYSVAINELSLDHPRSYTTQLRLRKMSASRPSVTQMSSSQSSVLYITDGGAVYLEVHSPTVYRDLFGTLQGFDPLDTQMPLEISLPSKVLLCSLGYSHLALVDEFGRIFMQGNNRFGQLGTGDKIDRGDPCQIQYIRNPIDIFCGLNHTLVLLPSLDFVKEIHGCGCGAGGRLPGWPKGSPSFVKLLLKQVPLCARRISSTRDCLYIMSSHDTEEHIGYRDIPSSRCDFPGSEELDAEVAQACEECLNQLLRCTSVQERVAKTKDFITRLPLQGHQKDCLWEALGMIQRAAETRQDGRAKTMGTRK
ncbi:F-box only protein 24 isoform X2 [Rhinoderma darwinii]|uniref:F-box only protein 24 isoform X2 n=1 Tax=Rhinoderma darwinii TaxID=43563 RepID=UPI003F667491